MAALLLLGGGLLYAAHVLFPDFGWIAFVSTAPWVLVLMQRRDWRYRRVCLAFGSTYYLVALVSTPWLRSFTLLGWILGPLFYLPFFVLGPLLTHLVLRLRPQAPLMLVWPLAFTSAEWIRIRTSAGELPLLQLGVGLVSQPTLAQIADVTGVSGLTALACITAVLVAAAADAVLRLRALGPAVRLVRRQALTVAGVAVGMFAYGKVRLAQSHFRSGPTVLVIQNNFRGWLEPVETARQQSELIRLTRLHASGRSVDLVAWPENTVTNLDPAEPQLQPIAALARGLHVPIVVDGPSRQPGGVVHHAVALVTGGESWVRYEKVVLVPWSEYLPFVPVLHRASPGAATAFTRLVRNANPHVIEMTAGTRAHTLPLETRDGRRFDVATPICYESLSPRLMASYFRHLAPGSAGAFVVNPVSERLLGPGIHQQTLALTRLRAIENRVTIIRASNNGISVAIDPNGRPYAWVKDRAGRYGTDVQGFFVAPVILDSRFGTVYSRWGDWLPAIFLVCLAGMILVPAGSRKRRHAAAASSSGTAHPR